MPAKKIKTFGQFIEHKRTALDKTPGDIARACGCSKQAFFNWRDGELPSTKWLAGLFKALEFDDKDIRKALELAAVKK